LINSKNPLIKKTLLKGIILLSITLIIAISLGITLSNLNNMEKIDNLLETKRPSLPSVLLDKYGEVITRFYSDEKRDLITLDMIPEYLVKGLIVWEDESFYHHHGFNPLAIFRAGVNNLIGMPVSGASTLTQQLATTLFLKKERSIVRKIKELFIAIQLEKKYTKNEILTLYLNHVPFGYGTNGVQAAAKFYFDKDVKDLTPAESASLITLISNPTFYSLIKFPKNHRTKQREVLKKMTKVGVITNTEFESTFNDFWLKWQATSNSARGAFYNREDQAPFFSNWVLNEVEKELPNVNIFRDGLVIRSTLDLKANKLAESLMKDILDKQQKIFEVEQVKNYNIIQNNYIDTINLIADTFSLSSIKVDRNKNVKRGLTEYNKDINPIINLTSQIFGLTMVETATDIMFDKSASKQNLLAQVQGAFVVVENETGQIVTMIGGKNFDPNNRFNYAMQSRRQPGSSFKPLIYSAALDSGMFTLATPIVDKPYVFTFDSPDPDDWYRPENYGGNYYGKVSVRRALRRSLNIPACQIFYTIGKGNKYKSPIDRAALLLGINSQEEIDERFKPEISTVLGTGSVAPIEMATAFATFANLGQRRIPNCILTVEDRDGKVIYDPWKELQKYYRENSKRLQVISQQNAFLITNTLRDTVHNPDGFLYGAKQRMIAAGQNFPPVELAAKTGTTQNWSDAWEVGFSPEITVSSWVGFNKYGLSLGYEQAGVVVLGPAFLEYMRQYHIGKGKLSFKNPGGVYQVKVCKQSGLLPSKYCAEDNLFFEYFLPGTVPTKECDVCRQNKEMEEKSLNEFRNIYEKNFDNSNFKLYDNSDIEVDKSILDQYESGNKNVDDILKEDSKKTDPTNIDDINTENKQESNPDLTKDINN